MRTADVVASFAANRLRWQRQRRSRFEAARYDTRAQGFRGSVCREATQPPIGN